MLMEEGIPINRRLIRFEPDIAQATRELLHGEDALDAVFCFNDQVAEECCQTILKHGLSISDDIGIIGYDNTDICNRLPVSLSSVSYKNYEIGEKAAELLWGILNEKPLLDFEYYLFQPGIVERESCKGPRLRI